ncbi:putative membrane protein [Bradyrhizobium algeriense]|uniref:Membrane protein n=2 Tax=Bradyrhizobium algeriense TaxID=634784 RepID=A0ABU8B6J6_9BRAD
MANREIATPDRMNAFSDGVFAVIITILVLELHPPREASFEALLELWPTAISYTISYAFIAIVWVNHHHLLRFPDAATQRLIWGNFAHLFAVSLIPFATAWIATTRLGAAAVAFYAGDFFLVNVTYLLLCLEAVDKSAPHKVEPRVRSMMRMRSFATLAVFAAAGVAALRYPIAGMALICLCLFVYLSPARIIGASDESGQIQNSRS